MIRALAVGFGLATAFATVMFACGGDDSGTGTSSGTAGTGSGTAGAGSGTAGAGSGTGGSAGVGTGAGGAFDLDAANYDEILGNATCADLAACCATLDANTKGQCTSVVDAKSDPVCSGVLTGFKQSGYCN